MEGGEGLQYELLLSLSVWLAFFPSLSLCHRSVSLPSFLSFFLSLSLSFFLSLLFSVSLSSFVSLFLCVSLSFGHQSCASLQWVHAPILMLFNLPHIVRSTN